MFLCIYTIYEVSNQKCPIRSVQSEVSNQKCPISRVRFFPYVSIVLKSRHQSPEGSETNQLRHFVRKVPPPPPWTVRAGVGLLGHGRSHRRLVVRGVKFPHRSGLLMKRKQSSPLNINETKPAQVILSCGLNTEVWSVRFQKATVQRGHLLFFCFLYGRKTPPASNLREFTAFPLNVIFKMSLAFGPFAEMWRYHLVLLEFEISQIIFLLRPTNKNTSKWPSWIIFTCSHWILISSYAVVFPWVTLLVNNMWESFKHSLSSASVSCGVPQGSCLVVSYFYRSLWVVWLYFPIKPFFTVSCWMEPKLFWPIKRKK